MTRLPAIVDFDARAFPELAEIFLDIDAGIAAIVASDPAMRPKAALQRRGKRAGSSTGTKRRAPRVQKAAA